MSWALVLNDAQERALFCLYSSAAPTADASGVHLTTIRSLARLGLVDGRTSTPGVMCAADAIDVLTPVRVTPAGFRALADLVEAQDARGP
jgi:hypothetical protein